MITGLGVISPIGQDVASFERNLFNGVGGIEMVDFRWRDLVVPYPAAPVKGFDSSVYLDAKKAALLDRFALFAVAAARQAFDDSGLTLTPEMAERTAVVTGTSVGGQNTLEDSFMKLLASPANPRAHPFTIPRLMSNAGSSHGERVRNRVRGLVRRRRQPAAGRAAGTVRP